jgi:outer membrane protein TolC
MDRPAASLVRRSRWGGVAALAGALFFASASLAGRTARAEDLPSPLKPEAVLKYAAEHRAEITAAKARAAAAAEVPKQVRALPDPMVMASVDHLPIKLDGINASFVVQQEFPLSGVLGARERAADADAKAATAQVDTTRLDVEHQALAAYLMVVEAQRMAAVLDDQVAIAKQVVTVAQARLAATEPAGADVLRAQLDVARLEGERTALDADLKGAASMLEAALGRPVKGEPPTCELTLPAADPPALAELVKKAVEQRPELSAMKASVAKANAEVDVMKSMYAPMAFVRAGGAYTMTDGPGFMLMVGVSIPLWREKLGAGVAEANSMVTMADSDVSAMTKMVEGEVGAARQGVIAARTRLTTVRDKVLPLSRSVLSLTIATYAAGQVPLVSVLDAAKAIRDARMDEVTAEVKAAAAWARLGRAIGVAKLGI